MVPRFQYMPRVRGTKHPAKTTSKASIRSSLGSGKSRARRTANNVTNTDNPLCRRQQPSAANLCGKKGLEDISRQDHGTGEDCTVDSGDTRSDKGHYE